MSIFLCFYILLKFPGRHPRSPCSKTSVSQPQSLPGYCLVRIICSKNWVQYVSLLLWINLSPVSKCISMLPQNRLSFFTPNLVVSEVWMSWIFLWIFYTTSSPGGINLSCFSEPSSCPMTRNPWHLCGAQPDTALHVCSQPEALEKLLSQPRGFWK